MKRILGSHKLIGVVFLALIAGGIWLTGAIFTKQFTDYDKVTMEASSVGLQLPKRADVKIRGVIVGEVLEFTSDGDGAELTLGLYPDKIDTIPANVGARIEPKTLFGQKFVSLKIPEEPAAESIKAGDTITRTSLSTEVEETLNNIYPLLRTVSPADLNRTLNALATALEGRGEKIGRSLETLDHYLKRINPVLPDLIEDLVDTGRVAEVYNDVLPTLAHVLDNTVKTGKTLRGREKRLNRLFDDVTRFSQVAGTFLDENEENLIRVGHLSEQTLRLLAKYSPGFTCLIGGVANAAKLEAEAFRGFTLHINLEVIPNQPRAWGPQDKPRYGAKDGPHCGGLPNPPNSQQNPLTDLPNFNDGVDEPTNKGTMRTAPGLSLSTRAGGVREAGLVRSLLAAQTKTPAREISDLSVLLAAPLMRGSEVELR